MGRLQMKMPSKAIDQNFFRKTEIGLVPFDWEVSVLGNVLRQQRESFDPTENPVVPYVGLAHIDSGRPRLYNHGTSDEVKSNKTYFYPRQILFGKLRPYLDKCVLVDFEGICSTDILVFEAIEDRSISDYIVFLLHTDRFLKLAIDTMSGVNHPRTNWNSLKKFVFALPPPSEQRRIATVLNIIQDEIVAQDDIIQELYEFKRSVVEHLFTYGLFNKDLETKKTQLGDIPAKWELKTVEDIANTVTVGIVVRPQSYYVEDGIPAFRSLNIKEDRISTNDLIYIDPVAHETTVAKSRLRFDDILIVRTGYTGTSCTVPKEFDNSNCIDLVIVRGDNNKVINRYLSRFFNSSFAKKQTLANETGMAQKHLNVGAVKRTLVPIPSLEEQKLIVEKLEMIDEKIGAEEDRKTALEEFFRTMLHQLMTGQIRLLSDEGLEDLLP